MFLMHVISIIFMLVTMRFTTIMNHDALAVFGFSSLVNVQWSASMLVTVCRI